MEENVVIFQLNKIVWRRNFVWNIENTQSLKNSVFGQLRKVLEVLIVKFEKLVSFW